MRAAGAVTPHAELLTREHTVEAARQGTVWFPANPGQQLFPGDRLRTGALSRATLRLTDLSVLRVGELSTVRILAPAGTSGGGADLRRGSLYFISRDRPQELRVTTPIATGALRGTEFVLTVGEGGRTLIAMFDGAVELRNEHGTVLVNSGEQGQVEPGHAPTKTAAIEARNIVQWWLYYPAILDPAEIQVSSRLQPSLAAYRQGDLLAALARYPAGYRAGTAGETVYRAALLLSVGQVERARALLRSVPRTTPGAEALLQLIAAVLLEEFAPGLAPRRAGDYLALSYYEQAHGRLDEAREAARAAVAASPGSGFAHARLAEMEFSFGRLGHARKETELALEGSPRHAQALALQGFLLSAENRMTAARRSFEEAMAIDPALANAWLGRGLALIRRGESAAGRQDLQTAAALEPRRSLLRSYLGKAFSDAGLSSRANAELQRARELDPADPTPWLYSALEQKQENRYNDAIRSLETSQALNENRRLYRSSFLLDQDQAVRGANLAAIYRNNGLIDQSVREAVRAVNYDYASASAHLFLSNSYAALLDPNRAILRFETAAENELLLAQLLSPVGGGSLSQFVSQQEYSKFFTRDRLGFSSQTDYLGSGDLRHTASLFGTAGNVSFALDEAYLYLTGDRPNSKVDTLETYATFKLQLTPNDVVLLQGEGGRSQTGDTVRRYDPREVETYLLDGLRRPNRAALNFENNETQSPGAVLLGWQHQWAPGNHTLLLLSRLASDQRYTAPEVFYPVLRRELVETLTPSQIDALIGLTQPQINDRLRGYRSLAPVSDYQFGRFDVDHRTRFEVYGADLQQIIRTNSFTTVAGARYQQGSFDTRSYLTNFAQNEFPFDAAIFDAPPAAQDVTADFQRLNLHLYETWRPLTWLALTGGLAWDWLQYPQNFRSPPVNDRQDSLARFSPKAGLVAEPWKGAVFRAAYAQSVSGTSFDESVRLEPSQVAGFLQSFRSVAPEGEIGQSVAGARYTIYGISLEQKLPTGTYLGAQLDCVEQRFDLTRGIFEALELGASPLGNVPSSLGEKDVFRETVLTLSANQLLGRDWSLGARYRYSKANLSFRPDGLGDALRRGESFEGLVRIAPYVNPKAEAGLHILSLTANYNHPSGVFARLEGNWYQQNHDASVLAAAVSPLNERFVSKVSVRREARSLPSEDFWQFNLFAGYRFLRNQCEFAAGILNLSDTDYRLSALSYYEDIVRQRTLFIRLKLNF